jgi:hypothetical protein
MQHLQQIIITYDIACQYEKKIKTRFEGNKDFLKLPSDYKFLIPKFHLTSHKEECQVKYSLNYYKGVGRSDGEGLERFWSPHNHLSSSTSKMTPGFRLDTLNLHFTDWNMCKSNNMGIGCDISTWKYTNVHFHSTRPVHTSSQSPRTVEGTLRRFSGVV